jgi:hypothetical protein
MIVDAERFGGLGGARSFDETWGQINTCHAGTAHGEEACVATLTTSKVDDMTFREVRQKLKEGWIIENLPVEVSALPHLCNPISGVSIPDRCDRILDFAHCFASRPVLSATRCCFSYYAPIFLF